MNKRRLLAALLCLVAACGGPENWPHQKFDAATWRAENGDHRYKFVNDLVDRKIVFGLTAIDVERLLGAADSWGSDRSYCIYIVKTGGYAFNQVYVLDVGFDRATGKVNSVKIRGD